MRHRDRWLAGLTLGAIVTLIGWSYLTGGVANAILSPSIEGAEKIRYIQNYFNRWGSAAPLIYMVLVTMEVVVAPIPGTMFYLPGGLVFGWQLGGLTSLLGNVIGAGLCCAIARALGRPFAERFFQRASLAKYDATLSRNALWVILLLRINPLTSSDLVSYAAGLTSMSTWRVMLGTMLGMAPLCFLQAYFAEELFTRFPVSSTRSRGSASYTPRTSVWILARLKAAPAPDLDGGRPV